MKLGNMIMFMIFVELHQRDYYLLMWKINTNDFDFKEK